jgi:hypothetical protein
MQTNFSSFGFCAITIVLTRPGVPPHVKAVVAKHAGIALQGRNWFRQPQFLGSEGFDCVQIMPDLFGLSRPVGRT